LANADFIVKCCAFVVTALAILEYFFLDTYLQYFNIIAYYISRGSVELEQIQYLSTTLFASGIRPEGRTFFPFLGDHRVSSLFLEPVSPGNFAVILFLWALVRSKTERTFYWGLFLMAVFLIIMADNRFGAYVCTAAFATSLLPSRFLHKAIWVAPIVAITALLGISFWYSDVEGDNSLLGRLLSSGQSLAGFDISDWLGVGEINETWDSGYAYTVGRIGIFGLAAFWGLLMALKGDGQFQLFRSLCGLYFAAILCVSYSPYTIKTAGILWFLLGTLSINSRYLRAAARLKIPHQFTERAASQSPQFKFDISQGSKERRRINRAPETLQLAHRLHAQFKEMSITASNPDG
jgi:putative polymerase